MLKPPQAHANQECRQREEYSRLDQLEGPESVWRKIRLELVDAVVVHVSQKAVWVAVVSANESVDALERQCVSVSIDEIDGTLQPRSLGQHHGGSDGRGLEAMAVHLQ